MVLKKKNRAKTTHSSEQEKSSEDDIAHRAQELQEKDKAVERAKNREYGPMSQEAKRNGAIHEEGTPLTKEEGDVGDQEKEEREVKRRKNDL